MINITGSQTLDAHRERIWPLIFNPNTLLSMVPGCERLEQIAPDEYRGQISIRVAAVRGKYDTCVKVVEYDPPEYCRFEGEVSGSTGTMTGEATFRLKEVGQKTVIEYAGKAMITGALARISPRLIEGVAQTFISQGLAKLNEQLQIHAPSGASD